MITLLNNQTSDEMREKYSRIFNSAYMDLKENDRLTDNDPSRFTDLAHYYAHMLDYLQIGKPIYLLLPLDEGHFAINANTREIDIPKEFRTCGGVTDDNLCEIAVFTIDRYFDYVDLANPRVQIVVQWKNAAQKQGLTKITLIDKETFYEEGLIRFGWPITKDITEAEGAVQFAVKFFIVDAVTNEATHILNTLPATLNIKKGLTLDKDQDIVEVDIANSIFEQFVSNNVGEVSGMPSTIDWDNYSWYIDGSVQGTAKINKDSDSLVLKALGHTGDLNALEYTWYQKAKNEDDKDKKVIELTELVSETGNPLLVEGVEYIEYIHNSTDEFPHKDFWYEVETGVYAQYNGNTWPDYPLYLRYATLTFNPDTREEGQDLDITGAYYVVAKNKKGNREDLFTINHTSPCVICSPAEILFREENMSADNHKILENGQAILKMTIEKSSLANNPDMTAVWTAIDNDNANIQNLITAETLNQDGSKEFSCTATTPGYYNLTISSLLNRKIENSPSLTPCKVTNAPEVPVIAASYFGVFSNEPAGGYDKYISEFNSADGEWSNEDGLPKIDQVDGNKLFFLKIDLTEDLKDNPLLSDKITYQWQFRKQDSEKWVDIDNTYLGEYGLVPVEFTLSDSKNYILLRCIWGDDESYAFRCAITNTIVNTNSTILNSQVIQLTNPAPIAN